MNALFKLIKTSEDAHKLLKICEKNKCKILHNNHGVELNSNIINEGGFSKNFGGYGSYSKLGIGDNFYKKWGLKYPLPKNFSKVMASFEESIDNELVSKISNFISKNGGKIVHKDKCNLLIKNKNSSKKIEEKYAEGYIITYLDEFLRIFPSINLKPKKNTKKLSADVRLNIKNLQKRDLNIIEKTIKELQTTPNLIDDILNDVKVNIDGEIERGKDFKGTKPSLSYSDLGLLNLLSISKDNSKGCELRNSIKKLDLAVQEIPVLNGFDSLEHLTITINNKNELIKKDLTSFGEFRNLKKLIIKVDSPLRPRYGTKKVVIQSLDGLKAPKLEFLEANDLGLSNINSLITCKELLILSLDQNNNLEDISPLINNEKLQILYLNETSIETLNPLKNIFSLKQISISNCHYLTTLKGLENLSLKISNRTINDDNKYDYSYEASSLKKLKSLVSIEHLPKLTTPKLVIDETKISSLKGIERLQELKYLVIFNEKLLSDIRSIVELKNLKGIKLSWCPKIKDYSYISELKALSSCSITSNANGGKLSGKVNKDILPKCWPETLNKLSLATNSSSLGKLPKNLTLISLEGPNLKTVKELAECPNLSYDSEFSKFDLSACISLKNLEGLENKLHVNKIFISQFINNLDSLNDKEDLELTIYFKFIQNKNYEISKELAKSLSKLKNFKLFIRTEFDIIGEKLDLSNIGSLKNVNSLDLDKSNIKDLSFISSMQNLNYVKLNTSNLTKELKRKVFETEGQIAKLKIKLLSTS